MFNKHDQQVNLNAIKKLMNNYIMLEILQLKIFNIESISNNIYYQATISNK